MAVSHVRKVPLLSSAIEPGDQFLVDYLPNAPARQLGFEASQRAARERSNLLKEYKLSAALTQESIMVRNKGTTENDLNSVYSLWPNIALHTWDYADHDYWDKGSKFM